MKYKQGFVPVIIAIIIVALVFVLYVLVYSDSKTPTVDEFGRVISSDGINRGLKDPGLVAEDSTDGVYTRIEKEVDENMLPTRRATLGDVSFVYPPVLSYELLGTSTARLYHETPSKEHFDYCDLKNDVPQKSSSIFDVDFRIEVYTESVSDVIKNYYSHLVDFALNENGDVILEKLSLNKKHTVYYFESGAEGCGQHNYFIRLGKEKTVVVNRSYVPYLNALDATSTLEYMSLEGVIVPDKEEELVSIVIGGII